MTKITLYYTNKRKIQLNFYYIEKIYYSTQNLTWTVGEGLKI